MNNFVTLINKLLTAVADLLLWPFSALAPVWGLTFASVLAGVLLLLTYKFVSNQRAISAAKSRVYGALLETVLFRQDLRLCLRAQGRLFKETCRYFFLAVPPVLILTLPCLLILAQLNQRYGLRPFAAEEAALLRVRLNSSAELFNVALSAPQSVDVTPPLRIAEHNEIYWRIKNKGSSAQSGEPQIVTLQLGSQRLARLVEFGAQSAWIEPLVSNHWLWRLFYPLRESPGEGPFQSAEFELNYPDNYFPLLGLSVHWLVFFFVVSLAGGLVTAKIFKVEI